MLRELDRNDIPEVIKYIGEDYVQCFYMYMDIIECGIDGENLRLWADFSDQIECVYYQYYDCLHIYSKTGCNIESARTLIDMIDPKVISSSEVVIDQIKTIINEDDYLYELNHIITADRLFDAGRDVDIKEASAEDIPEIAALMLKADIFSDVYNYDGLCSSLLNRLNEGFGRLFMIRNEEGRLIATNATNAETETLAVIGGLVTDPEMRGKGLGRAITASTWNLVKREGKQGLAYLISDNHNTISLHKKMGFLFIGYSARLIKK